MKKIIICLLCVVASQVGYTQDKKILIEVGGAYGNTSYSQPLNVITVQSRETKSPKLQTQIGIGISPHSYIGVNYNLTKYTDIAKSSATNEMYTSRTQNETREKTNAFGVFYRAYFLPFDKSRWNTFAEISPSYQIRDIDGENISVTAYETTDQSMSDSQETWSQKQKALDFDLKVGGSYRVADNFHVQLSLRSLANVNYTFNNSYALPDDQKTTTYQFFKSPLSNTYLSFLFTL